MSEENKEEDRKGAGHRDGKKGRSRNDVKHYSQYYGMAFQIFGILVVTVFIGMQIDKYLGNESNYIAVLLAFIVLVAYFYKLIIMLGKKD